MKILFISVLASYVLTACSSCGTHRDFVETINSGVGEKAFMDAVYYQKQPSSHKTMYKNKMVYTTYNVNQISFNGEGLVKTGKYCGISYLIDAETLKRIDWKYLKGSNPEACVSTCSAW